MIKPMVRLRKSFDSEMLKAELESVRNLAGAPAGYLGENHAGWTALTIFSAKTHSPEFLHGAPRSQTDVPAQRTDAGAPAPAGLLDSMPYYRHVLSSLRCPIEMARLMTLKPNGVIAPHRDAIIGFEEGLLRLHVPVITHPDVEMFIDDVRCEWGEGELWYGDFSRVHRAVNRSTVTRIHLIIDTLINDETIALFPRSFPVPDITSSDGSRRIPLPELSFILPAGFSLPGLQALSRPAQAHVRPLGDDLAVWVDDQPLLKLRPKSAHSMTVLGLGCDAELDLVGDDTTVKSAVLRLASLGLSFSFPAKCT